MIRSKSDGQWSDIIYMPIFKDVIKKDYLFNDTGRFYSFWLLHRFITEVLISKLFIK